MADALAKPVNTPLVFLEAPSSGNAPQNIRYNDTNNVRANAMPDAVENAVTAMRERAQLIAQKGAHARSSHSRRQSGLFGAARALYVCAHVRVRVCVFMRQGLHGSKRFAQKAERCYKQECGATRRCCLTTWRTCVLQTRRTPRVFQGAGCLRISRHQSRMRRSAKSSHTCYPSAFRCLRRCARHSAFKTNSCSRRAQKRLSVQGARQAVLSAWQAVLGARQAVQGARQAAQVTSVVDAAVASADELARALGLMAAPHYSHRHQAR